MLQEIAQDGSWRSYANHLGETYGIIGKCKYPLDAHVPDSPNTMVPYDITRYQIRHWKKKAINVRFAFSEWLDRWHRGFGRPIQCVLSWQQECCETCPKSCKEPRTATKTHEAFVFLVKLSMASTHVTTPRAFANSLAPVTCRTITHFNLLVLRLRYDKA